MRGLLGTDSPDLTLESASPSPPQGSIWHRNRVKSRNRCCTRAIPEVRVMKLWNSGSKNMVDFWWQMFCQFSPGKIGLKFATETFTTSFTARKEICHLELTLGASLPNRRRINAESMFGDNSLRSTEPSEKSSDVGGGGRIGILNLGHSEDFQSTLASSKPPPPN